MVIEQKGFTGYVHKYPSPIEGAGTIINPHPFLFLSEATGTKPTCVKKPEKRCSTSKFITTLF